jgi:hypothetical protein
MFLYKHHACQVREPRLTGTRSRTQMQKYAQSTLQNINRSPNSDSQASKRSLQPNYTKTKASDPNWGTRTQVLKEFLKSTETEHQPVVIGSHLPRSTNQCNVPSKSRPFPHRSLPTTGCTNSISEHCYTAWALKGLPKQDNQLNGSFTPSRLKTGIKPNVAMYLGRASLVSSERVPSLAVMNPCIPKWSKWPL